MRTVFLCILIATCAVAAGAAGKQTVDPNRGNNVSVTITDADDSVSIWAADNRLEKLITYSAHRRMVYQVLDDVEKLAGVTLLAGRSTSDWKTRELRMNLAVKDLPLRDLMQSVARVMQLRWIRGSRHGKYTYRLVGEKVAVEETPEDKEARELHERRKSFFTQYVTLANMSPAQLDRLKTANPALHSLSENPLGLPFAKVLAQSPAASMALMDGKELRIRASDLPLSAANDLMAAIRAAAVVSAEQDHDGKPASVPLHPPMSLDAISVAINPSDSSTTAGLGFVEISYEGKNVPLTFADPKPARKSVDSSSNEDEPPSVTKAAAEPEPELEPVVAHRDEPDLHRKITLDIKGEQATWGELQAALCDASGYSVISDSFEHPLPTHDVPKGEIEFRNALAAITLYERNWDKRGRVIEIRDRGWAHKRTLIIPQSTLKTYREALSKDSKLPEDVLAELMALPNEQFHLNINSDNGLGAVASAVVMASPVTD